MQPEAPYRKRAIPSATRRAVAERYGLPKNNTRLPFRCAYCPTIGYAEWSIHRGQTCGWVMLIDLEWDHIIPEFLGGTSAPENIAWACRPCNRSKRDRLLHEWRIPA